MRYPSKKGVIQQWTLRIHAIAALFQRGSKINGGLSQIFCHLAGYRELL